MEPPFHNMQESEKLKTIEGYGSQEPLSICPVALFAFIYGRDQEHRLMATP
jgi:hypothetical protein